MVGGGGEVAQGYEFTKRATRFESSFADADGDSAKGAVPITVLPDKVCGVGDWLPFWLRSCCCGCCCRCCCAAAAAAVVGFPPSPTTQCRPLYAPGFEWL